MKNITLWGWAILLCVSCNKADIDVDAPDGTTTRQPTSEYIKYTINKGDQYCDKSAYKAVELQELKFNVRFDSSAIYQTASKINQLDINKLYGFSDNNSFHHLYSARIGWRWSDNALRLFAYIYNDGVRQSEELGAIPIGKEVYCSIKVNGDEYVFTMNDTKKVLPRKSKTAKGQGYMLYPYFGGDELAPHNISIWIMDI